jgi:hypothetical protein
MDQYPEKNRRWPRKTYAELGVRRQRRRDKPFLRTFPPVIMITASDAI